MKTERFDLIRKGGTQVTPAAPSPVVLPNSGGSICSDVFQDVLRVPSVWIPLSLRRLLSARARRAHPLAADAPGHGDHRRAVLGPGRSRYRRPQEPS